MLPLSAQRNITTDTLQLAGVQDFSVDDYGNLYLYCNKDFSFTKYDSVGRQLGKLMFTVPFRVQSVQNPLSVPFFSENAQEMKFVDQNLNEIQKIDFSQKFPFVRFSFAEDLQQIWILEESSKRLLQYNFRTDNIVNAYSYSFPFEDLLDMLVYDSKVYILTKTLFRVYNLRFDVLYEAPFSDGKKLRRENDRFAVFTKKSVFFYGEKEGLNKVFEDPEAEIVDKNSTAFFVLKANKLYLYRLEKLVQSKDLKIFETGIKTSEQENPERFIKDILESEKVLRETEKEPASEQKKE